MEIVFNATMMTSFNFSWLNDTSVDIYIEPAENRQSEATFKLESVNLTWSVLDYID